MPFAFSHLELDGLVVIEPQTYTDSRGHFLETYKRSPFVAAGIPCDFVQDNYSYSTKGVLRGLHYQVHPHEQGKLLTVLHGAIWDVAVDCRRSSKTFSQWAGIELSAARRSSLWIPAGFAHGFLCLSASAGVCYKTTTEYCQDAERGIRWNDPSLAIEWPEEPSVVSERDAALPEWEKADYFP